MLPAGTAWAHHNNTRFDPEKLVTVTGTLSKLDWRNPHVYIYADVKNDQGQVADMVAGVPAAQLFRHS